MPHTDEENKIKKGFITGRVKPLAMKMGLSLSHLVSKSGLPKGVANPTRPLISHAQEGPVTFLGG